MTAKLELTENWLFRLEDLIEDDELLVEMTSFIGNLLSQQRKEFVKTHKELFDCKLKLKEE